jgi:D-alanine-D-alanine ligase
VLSMFFVAIGVCKVKRFQRVAVLMGGPSEEREVSLRSGAAVAGGLRGAGYDVVEVDVKGHEIHLPDSVEAAFIALHGEFGEDGGVQAILDGMSIPYTGSGSRSSNLAFDKALTKQLLVDNGVPTPSYEVLRSGENRTLEFPLVVKPSCQGSSLGITKVSQESEWDGAVKEALSYGDEIVVEEYIEGRELTVGIVGDTAFAVVEIEAPDNWYDYDAKYTKGACRYLAPAPIDDDCAQRCKQLSMQTFNALGSRGLARVDLIADKNGGLHVLELNSIPGFTETSLLPMSAAEAGMSFVDLCDTIMAMAEYDRS